MMVDTTILEIAGVEHADIKQYDILFEKEYQKLVICVKCPSKVDDLLAGFYLSQDNFCGTFITVVNDKLYCEGCTVSQNGLDSQSNERTYIIDITTCNITFNKEATL